MKLQKHFAYTYKDKKRFKHVVVIPDEIIKELGWQEGAELERKIDGNILIIKPINQEQPQQGEKSLRNKRTNIEVRKHVRN